MTAVVHRDPPGGLAKRRRRPIPSGTRDLCRARTYGPARNGVNLRPAPNSLTIRVPATPACANHHPATPACANHHPATPACANRHPATPACATRQLRIARPPRVTRACVSPHPVIRVCVVPVRVKPFTGIRLWAIHASGILDFAIRTRPVVHRPTPRVGWTVVALRRPVVAIRAIATPAIRVIATVAAAIRATERVISEQGPMRSVMTAGGGRLPTRRRPIGRFPRSGRI
jgi:hypothetical protein